jgi:hypothetical protein
MKKRRFLPLFVTQFLNAFNDNFFKMAMVVLITYTILQGGEKEEAYYNAFAGAIFILPFFLLSASLGPIGGQHRQDPRHPHGEISRNRHHDVGAAESGCTMSR